MSMHPARRRLLTNLVSHIQSQLDEANAQDGQGSAGGAGVTEVTGAGTMRRAREEDILPIPEEREPKRPRADSLVGEQATCSQDVVLPTSVADSVDDHVSDSLLASGETVTESDAQSQDEELETCVLCESADEEANDVFHLCSNGAISRLHRDPCGIRRLIALERSASDETVAAAVKLLATHSLREVDVHNNSVVGAATIAALCTPRVARVVQFIDLGRCLNIKVEHMTMLLEAYAALVKDGDRVALQGIRMPPCTNATVLHMVKNIPMLRSLILCDSNNVDDEALAAVLKDSRGVLEYLGLEGLVNITGRALTKLHYSNFFSRLRIKDCPELNLYEVSLLVSKVRNLNVLELLDFGGRPAQNEAVLQRHILRGWSTKSMYSLTVDDTIVPASRTILFDLVRRFPLRHLHHNGFVGDERAKLQSDLENLLHCQPVVSGINRLTCMCDSKASRPKRGVVTASRATASRS